jgi:hypothetical protein
MHRFLVGCLLVSFFGVAGCGGGESPHPFTDHTQDAEAYAKEVKTLTVRMAEATKTSPEPADNLRALVEQLENPNAPQGNYQATYTEILNVAKPLLQECEQAPNGKPKGLNQKLDQLAKAAEKLPGEVAPAGPEDTSTAPVSD